MLVDRLGVADRAVVSLADVLAQAPAMTRVDRKYVLTVDQVRTLLEDLSPQWRTLSVAGRRTTHYRSTYFDTATLETVRAHVQGRRRRWKARCRLYVEDRLCRLEVKTRDGRGRTVKTVVDRDHGAYGRLDPADLDVVTGILADRRIDLSAALLPTAEVAYERLTLARTVDAAARLTIDWGVSVEVGDQTVWLDRDHVLLETKGGLQPNDADRLLLGHGLRPAPFSKYAGAVSLVRPDIPDNDVRRLVGRVLHVTPTEGASTA